MFSLQLKKNLLLANLLKIYERIAIKAVDGIKNNLHLKNLPFLGVC